MCAGTLIPNVMHDLLEGALQHILKHLLHVLISEKKYFTITELNSKIAGMDGNRPSKLTRGELRENGICTLHLTCIIIYLLFYCDISASQTWTLGRLLPIMIGHKVPEGDEHWKHYLNTLQVTNYLLAPGILPDEVAYLSVILREHHEMFVQLYPVHLLY